MEFLFGGMEGLLLDASTLLSQLVSQVEILFVDLRQHRVRSFAAMDVGCFR